MPIASFLPYWFVSVLRVLPYLLYHIVLFHRPSYNSYSACLLPTVHLGNTASYLNRSYTHPGGSRQQAEGFALEQFYDPPFLPRTIAYTARVGIPADAWQIVSA